MKCPTMVGVELGNGHRRMRRGNWSQEDLVGIHRGFVIMFPMGIRVLRGCSGGWCHMCACAPHSAACGVCPA